MELFFFVALARITPPISFLSLSAAFKYTLMNLGMVLTFLFRGRYS